MKTASDALSRRQKDIQPKPKTGNLAPVYTDEARFLTRGLDLMRTEQFGDAACVFEFTLEQVVPLSNRFNSAEAAPIYEQLALAYRNQADALRKAGESPEQVTEAVMLAKHNELRLQIYEARTGQKWRPAFPN